MSEEPKESYIANDLSIESWYRGQLSAFKEEYANLDHILKILKARRVYHADVISPLVQHHAELHNRIVHMHNMLERADKHRSMKSRTSGK